MSCQLRTWEKELELSGSHLRSGLFSRTACPRVIHAPLLYGKACRGPILSQGVCVCARACSYVLIPGEDVDALLFPGASCISPVQHLSQQTWYFYLHPVASESFSVGSELWAGRGPIMNHHTQLPVSVRRSNFEKWIDGCASLSLTSLGVCPLSRSVWDVHINSEDLGLQWSRWTTAGQMLLVSERRKWPTSLSTPFTWTGLQFLGGCIFAGGPK